MGPAAIAVLVAAAVVQAEEAEPRRLVMLAFESQRAVSEELGAAAGAQLSGLPTELVIEWTAAPEPVFRNQLEVAKELGSTPGTVAVFWYEVGADGEGLLYLADAASARLLVRRLPAEDEEARADTAALIVVTAVESLLRGGAIGVVEPALTATPPPPPPAAPPVPADPPAPEPAAEPDPPPPPPEPSAVAEYAPRKTRLFLGLGGSFAAQFRSREELVIYGLALEVLLAPTRWLRLHAGYTFWSRVRVDGDAASIEVRRHPTHLGAGYLWEHEAVRIGARVSLLIDLATQATLRVISDVPTAEPRENEQLLVSVVPELVIGLHPLERLELSVRLGAEVALNKVEYVYERLDGKETIESPWRVQPRVLLGVVTWLL